MAAEANHPRTEPLGSTSDDPTLEASEADSAEQRAVADETDDGWPSDVPFDVEADAPEADVVEQAREVRGDEDDYR